MHKITLQENGNFITSNNAGNRTELVMSYLHNLYTTEDLLVISNFVHKKLLNISLRKTNKKEKFTLYHNAITLRNHPELSHLSLIRTMFVYMGVEMVNKSKSHIPLCSYLTCFYTILAPLSS